MVSIHVSEDARLTDQMGCVDIMGIWPTVEKAKQIADLTVRRRLDPDCTIVLD